MLFQRISSGRFREVSRFASGHEVKTRFSEVFVRLALGRRSVKDSGPRVCQ